MPAMTLQQIMSQATAALGNRTEFNPSLVSFQANMALEEVAAQLPHTELYATTNVIVAQGSTATTVPADFAECVDISRPNSYDSFSYRLLTLVPPRQIDNASEGTALGQVNRYAISANTLMLYPGSASTDTLLMRYIRVPADMVALTDRPSIHTRYHTAVFLKTCEYMADQVVDNARAAYYRNRYISTMQSLPTPSDALNRSERTLAG